MTSRVRTVTFDSHNPYELAGFWLQVLRTERPDEDHPGDPYASVPPKATSSASSEAPPNAQQPTDPSVTTRGCAHPVEAFDR
ncbi:hypothetical protein ACFCV3_25775 [Kribbella sp. NPDC056345]|uniref:hypothetical protein n=1 Tax=Kribbella sp. NPDC056345 TaxID=3345789 RepID=UPI0035DE5E68